MHNQHVQDSMKTFPNPNEAFSTEKYVMQIDRGLIALMQQSYYLKLKLLKTVKTFVQLYTHL